MAQAVEFWIWGIFINKKKQRSYTGMMLYVPYIILA
jgi:hypothetical protein